MKSNETQIQMPSILTISGAHRKAPLLQSAPVTNTTMPGGFISQTQPPAAQSTMQGPC